MSKDVISVSTLVHYLKSTLENDAIIQHVLVEGEISNFSNYRSGHWYFSLKDANAVLRCVMFASSNQKLDFIPKDGDKVIVTGSVSVYEARGDVQLLVTNMKANTLGDLYIEFERLKKKLAEEGLFDASHKKVLPRYPMRLALVTGANTAARSDVLTTLQRRWPIVRVDEYPVLVQGKESANQVIQALQEADTKNYDVILLVRGGGSIEDLWSFNDEQLARSIYALQTPIVTGIGHEINDTIADFVADLRAPTPTGAAELVSPNYEDVLETVGSYKRYLLEQMQERLEETKEELETYKTHRIFLNPERLYSERELMLHTMRLTFLERMQKEQNELHTKLTNYKTTTSSILQKKLLTTHTNLEVQRSSILRLVEQVKKEKVDMFQAKVGLLDAYSPLKVLQRGYSIVEQNEKTIKRIAEIQPNEELQIRLSDGSVYANVTRMEEGEHHGKKGS